MSRDDVNAIEAEIARLRGLDREGLQARWRTMFGRRPPAQLPRHLLLRVIAYRLQTDVHGDLDPASARYLDRLKSARGGEKVSATCGRKRACKVGPPG